MIHREQSSGAKSSEHAQPQQRQQTVPEKGQAGTNPESGMSELLQLLKTFITQQAQPKQVQPSPTFEIEPRNKQVLLPVPNLAGQKTHATKQLKSWLAEVTSTVFSSAFYYYSKGEMRFEQAKIFCSENILKNISRLHSRHPLRADDFETIDRHLVQRVLPYLGTKYPLTESSEVNKRLQSTVQEIDNMEEMANNYFNSSRIPFEFRKEGNYYDLIMKLINDLLERIDNTNSSGKTNYQQFEQFMTRTFKQVYDLDFMNTPSKDPSAHQGNQSEIDENLQEHLHKEKPKKNQPKDKSNKHIHKVISLAQEKLSMQQSLQKKVTWWEQKEKEREERKKKERDERRQRKMLQEEKEKYKLAVQQYTSFLIGRKVPQNVPLFSEEQIAQNKITIKHPAVLRILSKWFEQLWKKFQKNYFSNRSQSIKLQKGDNVHDLTPEYRRMIDRLMEEEKKKITFYVSTIEKLNYKLEARLLSIQNSLEGEDQMEEQERICAKFAYKVVRNLHNEIIGYLNKVIHSILSCSKYFHEELLASKSASEVEKANWPSPPNLISFNLGDLLRCKLSSREQEILKIYRQLIRLNQEKQLQKKFRIVRIKNRLKGSTNDILINIRFNEHFLCEIQLAIKSQTSGFIKASNAFHHYIYELQRSRFGPLSELCSIWMSLDGRAQIYQSMVEREKKFKEAEKLDCKCRQYLGELESEECFICNSCSHICLHNNYILKHLKCQNCRDFFKCAKCRIFDENFEVLKNKLTMAKTEKQSSLEYRRKLKENCIRLINNDWDNFQQQKDKYGMSIFIESPKVKVKLFKLVVYNRKRYLLGLRDNNQFYEIGDISNEHLLSQFQTKNIVIQVNEQKQIIQFSDLKAIKEYILPKMAANNYKKYKENMLLHLNSTDEGRKLNNEESRNILMSGNLAQRSKIKNIFASDNSLTRLPCDSSDFPNLEWLVLSYNPITTLEGLEHFTHLKTFVMQRNYEQQNIPFPDILCQLTQLHSLEKLVLSNVAIKQVPSQFKNLHKLKSLILEHCRLISIEHIGECTALQKLNLSNNCIVQAPTALNKLTQLESLTLQRNLLQIGVESKPDMFASIPTIQATSILLLDLSFCNVHTVPQSFSELVNLEVLDLQCNQIAEIDDSIFKQMKKLSLLNLSINQLRRLPDIAGCVRLSKFDVSFNQIEELPAFLNHVQIEEFKFQQCPIKRIGCVNWLKSAMDDSKSIIQKYRFWVEKLPSSERFNSHSQCITKFQPIDDPDISDQDQNSDNPLSPQNQEDCLLTTSVYQVEGDSSDESHQGSCANESPKIRKSESHASSQIGSFFKGIKKRVSLSLQEVEDSSQSDFEEEVVESTEIEVSQEEFQLQDMRIEQMITPEVLNRYFKADEMFVFEFQSKIRYSVESALFCKEINLYHDQSTPQIAEKFRKMLKEELVKCSRLNIYAGQFFSSIQGKDLNFGKMNQESCIIYDDLRRNRIPFTYAAACKQQRALFRGSQTVSVPSHLFTPQLEKISLYKIKELTQDIITSTGLTQLKVRQSNWRQAPLVIKECSQLSFLDLARNQIIEFDPVILRSLINLKVLVLTQNKFTKIPEVYTCKNLQVLDMSGNPIKKIPAQMAKLVNLRVFHIEQCPLQKILCKEWLSEIIEKQQILIHCCQFSVSKAHDSQHLRYKSHYETQKRYSWEDGETGYGPYSSQKQERYFAFFQKHFQQRKFRQLFGDKEFIAFKFVHKTKYHKSRIQQLSEFKVMVDADNPQTHQKFKSFLQQFGLQDASIAPTYLRFTTIPVDKHNDCFFCRKKLCYPFYWLRWEHPSPQEWLAWKDKPKFGCRACVEASHKERYFDYAKNSVLLVCKPLSCKLPANCLGKNLQPQNISQISRHNLKCDICGRTSFQLGEPRYLCLGCKSSEEEVRTEDILDFCSDCLEKEIREGRAAGELKQFRHKRWHPLLRVLFNTQGYYLY